MQKLQLLVVHNFKDMRVSTDHDIRFYFINQQFHARRPAARIAGDVLHHHLAVLALEHGDALRDPAHVLAVDIAVDGVHGRNQGLQFLNYLRIAHVTGVPHFVALLEIFREPPVPYAMRIAQYAYPFHFIVLMN